MSQRTPLSESSVLHHSSSSSLLNRSNNASRPGSPSTSSSVLVHNSVSTSSSVSSTTNSTSIHISSNGGYDHGAGALAGSSTGFKGDSYFSDHSLSVGNSGYSKRSKFGAGSYPLSTKRWRWWNYTAAMLLVFALVEGLVLLIGSTVLYSLPDQIQIGKARRMRPATKIAHKARSKGRIMFKGETTMLRHKPIQHPAPVAAGSSSCSSSTGGPTPAVGSLDCR